MAIKKLFEYIIKLLLMISMSFSFVYPFTTTLSFMYSPLQVLIATIIFLLIFSIFLINGIMTKVSIFSFLSGGLIVTLYSFSNKSINRITDPFVWIFGYIQGKETKSDYYAFVFTLLFSFVFSLIVYIFTVKKFNFYLLFLTGISIFCAQWMFDYFVEEKAYISFYTFVVSILIYYLLHIYNKKWAHDSNDFVNPSAFILFITPIAIAILFLTVFIPVNSRPIEWKWLDEKLSFAMNLNSRTGKTMNTGYFNISSTGFGNNNKLGSNVTLDKTLVMKVKSPNKLYLKGRSSDQYTGCSWINSNISYYELTNQNNKLDLDNFEFENAFILLFREYLKTEKLGLALPRFTKHKVEISFENINTNSLFTPLKTSKLNFNNSFSNDIFVNAEGVLISRKQLGKGFTYSFDTYNIKYGDRDFETLLRVSNQNFYDVHIEQSIDELLSMINITFKQANIYGMRMDIEKSDITQLILEAPNTEIMKENLSSYLQDKINKISNEQNSSDFNLYDLFASVRPLISSIDSEHFYGDNQDLFEWLITLSSLKNNSNTIYLKYIDIPNTVPQRVRELAVSITKNKSNTYDKVKAIEQYLSKNYKYSLTPGDVPDGVDFVDYFLFEQKEGYCTYFATAMAILTRSIGIPSRYVEGYLLPSYVGKDKLYEVTNERAHAWVEVYFEGIGWIQFEPTASFSHNLYQATTPSTSPVFTPTPSLSNNTPTSSLAPDTTSNPEQNNATKNTLDKKLFIKIVAVMSVILFIAIIVFLNIFNRKRRLSNIAKLPPREAVLELYVYFLQLLLVQKADINVGETPLDHARRLDITKKFSPHKMEEITEIFINARYSRDEVTLNDFNKVLSFYHPLLKSTKESIGRIKYILYMYVLFKI